ncbi:TetR/AcrR family transcriptional regulator [uncultured Marinobacter sp.]|uniref:TetR/AcrR family transcriptional regulator n=1 Tax=uncultured Marinobacter sp. TaxID=187379 RepID=UPI0030DBC2BE
MPARAQTAAAAPASPKRTAILEAALARFAESGVNGVAVPDIAARAEVGTGTIYRYFDSKEALVNALFQAEKARIEGYLTTEVAPGDDPRAGFNNFWQRMMDFALENPRSFRFLELQDHRPYLDKDSLALEKKVLQRRVKASQQLQQQGVFRDDLRAEIIMAIVWGALVNLIKAQQAGYISLSESDIEGARDACWRVCAGH